MKKKKSGRVLYIDPFFVGVPSNTLWEWHLAVLGSAEPLYKVGGPSSRVRLPLWLLYIHTYHTYVEGSSVFSRNNRGYVTFFVEHVQLAYSALSEQQSKHIFKINIFTRRCLFILEIDVSQHGRSL